MLATAERPEAPAAIRTDLGAIFVSMELSKSTWLITSLSPGAGEKMSRHAVAGGDIAGLFARFGELREKTQARTGKCYPFVVIQEAGLDGFWIDRVLRQESWIESHVVDAASIAVSRRRRRAKTDRIDGETLVRTLLAYKRGEPRVCSMVKVPTAEEEDRRRICRERKVLSAERVLHINRLKGLLFSQGISDYEPLRRDRRQRLEELRTGDGRALPDHLKAQSTASSIGSSCCSYRSRRWRPSVTRFWPRRRRIHPAALRCCLPSKASVPSLPLSSMGKVCFVTSTIEGRSQPMQGWRRPLGRVDRSTVNRASQKRVIRGCERR